MVIYLENALVYYKTIDNNDFEVMVSLPNEQSAMREVREHGLGPQGLTEAKCSSSRISVVPT